MSAIPTSVRVAVQARELGRCLVCAMPGHHIHHRVRRRDGGHTLANCILLCSTDHTRAHHQPDWAKTRGLIVQPWQDPATTPVRTYRGWLTLDNEGGIAHVDPPEDKP